MNRRKNGEGSWGKTIKNGYQYLYYKDSQGKFTYGKTQKEIKEKLKKKKNSIPKENKDFSKLIFIDALLYWLDNVKRIEIKENTYKGYRNCIIGEIENFNDYQLKLIQIAAITVDDINKYYLSLSKKYTYATIKKIHAIIVQFLKYCIKKECIYHDLYLQDIIIPHKDNIAKKTREIHFLNDDDMYKLIQESNRKINNENYYGVSAKIITFILYTGLRISECINLKWENVNLKERKIHIIDAKTKSGNRYVPLCEMAYNIIKKQKNTCEYVFYTKNNDKVKSRQNVNRTLKIMVKNANLSLSNVSPHELRHSFGSYLLRQGVNLNVISHILGHSSIRITSDIYIHILHEQELEATKKIDLLFTKKAD